MPPKNNDPLAVMAARLAAMEAENAALKKAAQSSSRISLKVSEKGALSVYGMGRFPVTLYAAQWERLLAEGQVGVIRAFLKEHASEFATKDTAKPATGVTATAPASPGVGKAF